MQNIFLRAIRFCWRKFILRNLREQYDEMLAYLRNNNVRIMGERKYLYSSRPKKATIILRHDVDRNLKSIDMIRRIEKKNMVRSTLHLRVKERTYKIEDLKKLDLKGFDVALHLESSALEDIKKDKDILEKATGRKVIGVSIHGGYYPNKSIISKKKLLQNLKKAGFKYITGYNESGCPKTEYGILLIPYIISDLEIVQSGYKEFMKKLNKIIEKGGCSVLNTHPEYF